MPDRSQLIGAIVRVMRDCWDLAADCNEGELFAYAEILLDRIEAGEAPAALYSYLSATQVQGLEMTPSEAYREIVDRSLVLAGRA